LTGFETLLQDGVKREEEFSCGAYDGDDSQDPAIMVRGAGLPAAGSWRPAAGTWLLAAGWGLLVAGWRLPAAAC
jgi:hypothetical protein